MRDSIMIWWYDGFERDSVEAKDVVILNYIVSINMKVAGIDFSPNPCDERVHQEIGKTPVRQYEHPKCMMNRCRRYEQVSI
jgi:hypothetical protein